MKYQDAVIAYVPAPDSDPAGVDLYHVEDPDTLALDDTLTPIGPDDYVLPTLDDIETSHDSDTPERNSSMKTSPRPPSATLSTISRSKRSISSPPTGSTCSTPSLPP